MASKKKSKKKYGAAAGRTVKKVMGEQKRGTLRSGRSKKKVTSRKQAIAIALSEARASGAKVPPRPGKRRSQKRSGSASAGAASKKRSTSGKKRSSKKKAA